MSNRDRRVLISVAIVLNVAALAVLLWLVLDVRADASRCHIALFKYADNSSGQSFDTNNKSFAACDLAHGDIYPLAPVQFRR